MTIQDRRRGAGPLWHHQDFLRLWTGDTISQFGAQITLLAIPLLAVRELHAGTFQVGLLETLQHLAFVVIGLPAGAWVDRMVRRRVLIGADLARCVLLLTLPAAYAMGWLTIGQLFVVATLFGAATVFFDVGYQSYLPGLVGSEHLVEGNSKLQASQSVARVAGPGVGGVLIGWLKPVGVLWFSALGYLWSAFWVWRIRADETVEEDARSRSLVRDISEGLRFVFGHRLLRSITMTTAISNLFSSAAFAVMIVYLARTLQLSSSVIGLLFMCGAIGGVFGAVMTKHLGRVIGQGPLLWISILVSGLLLFVPPTIHRDGAIWLFAVTFVALDVCVVVYNITQVSFRQTLCPPRLLGRMNATVRFVVWGTMPFGAFAGGLIGEHFGIRAALYVGACGGLCAFLPIFLSPLRSMRELPTAIDET